MEGIDASTRTAYLSPSKSPSRDNERVVLVVKEKVVTGKFLRKLEELSESLPKFKNPSKLLEEDRR